MYTFFLKKAVLSTTKYSTWIRDDVLQFKGQNLSLNKYLFFTKIQSILIIKKIYI